MTTAFKYIIAPSLVSMAIGGICFTNSHYTKKEYEEFIQQHQQTNPLIPTLAALDYIVEQLTQAEKALTHYRIRKHRYHDPDVNESMSYIIDAKNTNHQLQNKNQTLSQQLQDTYQNVNASSRQQDEEFYAPQRQQISNTNYNTKQYIQDLEQKLPPELRQQRQDLQHEIDLSDTFGWIFFGSGLFVIGAYAKFIERSNTDYKNRLW